MSNLRLIFFFCLFFFQTTAFGTITIGFGSCNQQGKDIGQYEQMFLANLDAWLWLGDNIYADFFPPLERRKAYDKIKKNFYYKALSQQSIILGTWDDHDYAYNNAGGSYRRKEESKQEFLRFINFPKDDEIRSRPGIYYDRIIKKNNLRVQLIFLDMRSFSSRKGLIGEEQWDWLKSVIKKNDVDIKFIISSINVLSKPPFYLRPFIEGWHQNRSDKRKILRLAKKSEIPVIFLSGDRHYSERSKVVFKDGRELYEFMSSGITKTSKINKIYNRIGEAINKPNFSIIDISKNEEVDKVEINHQIVSSETGKVFSSFFLSL